MDMKKTNNYLTLAILCLLMSSGKCNQQNMEWLEKVADTKWVHSFEDDKDELTAFRPSDYDFPPARGRKAWKLEVNGQFTDFPISPRDGNSRKEGKWETAMGNRIRITLDDGSVFTWEFHSLENGILYGIRR